MVHDLVIILTISFSLCSNPGSLNSLSDHTCIPAEDIPMPLLWRLLGRQRQAEAGVAGVAMATSISSHAYSM